MKRFLRFGNFEGESRKDIYGNLLTTWPDLPDELARTALLIAGHGRFELGDFLGAEAAYQRLLAYELPEGEHAAVEERLLAGGR